MKRILLPLSILGVLTQAQAAVTAMRAPEEPMDTTESVADGSSRTTDLSEIVVEGRTQRVIKNGVEYTPNKRTRKLATSAASLLQMMAIPQLDINPMSGVIAMTGGRDVKVFIDYQPATSQDLAGLRTEDVMRVEVLQFPEDPRFEGAANVVNFIMQKYEWGGYTKLTADVSAINVINGWGSVYSKYVKDKWTIDANVGASGGRIDRVEEDVTETFRNISVGTRAFDAVERHSYSDGGLYSGNGQWASVRAIYQTATVNIRHTLSFGRSGLPHDDKTSHVVYTDALFPSSDADSRESSVSTMPSVSARYLFILPKNNVVTVNWNMGYSHTTRSLLYRLGQLDPIANDNRDNTYTPSANIYYTKKLGHNNTFRAAISTSNSISDTHYSGSYDGLQRVRTSDNQLLGEYSQNWSNGLSLFSRAGVTYTLDRVNGVNTLNQWNPLLGVQLQYYINQKHMASASAWWTSGSPAASSANSALVQSNELLWLMGNPDLRGTSNREVSLSYYFIPTNAFSLSVYGKYDDTDRNLVYEYMSLPGYDGLVRRTINSGSRNTWTGDLSATLRLLRNSLVVNGGVSAQRVVLTGIDAQSHNTLIPRIYASYMTGHFAFSANFSSGGTSINSSPLNRRFKNPCNYGVQVTYAVGEFKAQLSSSNWWNKGRMYTDYDSEHYSSHGWTWVNGLTAGINLHLSYTFTYGKKVSRDDQLGKASTGNSAILK